MGKLYYFQAPSFDIDPDSEIAPKLGSIFPNLHMLTAPLNQDDYVSVPEHVKNRSVLTHFAETVDQSLQAEASVGTNVLQGSTGSIDVIYAFARNKKNIYSCSQLETLEFAPTQEFVNECITASPGVQAFIENSIVGRKRVYMITGLKIATGFTMSSTKATQHSPQLRFAANAMLTGVPLDTGLGLQFDAANSRTVESGQTVNRIVFAYRVIRIKLSWDGLARYKYRSGGRFAVDDGSDEDREDKWVLMPLDAEDRPRDFPDSVQVEQRG
ncbi:hypothetical protein VPNG_03033 [Cytospora leucostoma]|uniref:Uncharacterized protein n=1 Tax=Cytospora leucostoma TaxID=1230097 RepID=A0A423XG99_9PEZI|nr:hypothetical protein VPNG_03033 [Cytospora leucostoma]